MKNKSVQISNLTPLLLKKITALNLKNVITMFVRCTVYEIWFFFSFCHFGVDQPFCYVVCEHLHNVDEGASYLSLFCYRPVSLPTSRKLYTKKQQWNSKIIVRNSITQLKISNSKVRKQQKLLTWRGTLVSYLSVKLRLASAIPCFEQYCKKLVFHVLFSNYKVN